MNSQDFIENLKLYGTQFEQWPMELQQSAQNALLESAELQVIVAQEKEFEAQLQQFQVVEPNFDFNEKILRAASQQALEARESSPFRFDWFWELFASKPAIIGALALLIFGFWLGFSSKFQLDSNNEASLEVASVFEEDLWD